MKKFGVGKVVGWRGESQRHSLAARKVRTGRALHYEGDLGVRYDSRKSFYGKASVRTEGDKLILRSYSTDVAQIENGKATVFGTYSQTTLRHIKEFLKQNGFEAESSKQIMKDYGAKESDEKAKSEREESEADSHFKTVAMVSQLGEIFGKTEKEKNDWKARMLKAGLEGRGLQMPEDWESLSEAEKKKRLDAVIGVLKEKPKKSLSAKGKHLINVFVSQKTFKTVPYNQIEPHSDGLAFYQGKMYGVKDDLKYFPKSVRLVKLNE